MAVEETLESYKKQKVLLEENLKLQEEALKKQKEVVDQLELELSKRDARNKLDKEYLDILLSTDEQIDASLEKLMFQIKQEESRADDRKRLSEAELQALRDQADELGFLRAAGKDVRDGLAEELSERIKINEEFEKTVGHATKFGERMKGILGIGMEFGETWIGGLTEAGKLMGSLASESGSLGKVVSSGLMAMGPKIMCLWATKTEELLVATDKLLTSFVKSTGANEAFRQSVVGSMDSLRMMGLSMEHAGTAAAALYAGTVSFKDASQEAQESMITFVATLEQAGVSAQ